MEQVGQLVDARYSKLRDYDSIEGVTSCRIFELVEMLTQKYIKKRKVYYPPVPTELVSLADEQHPIEVRLVPLTAYQGMPPPLFSAGDQQWKAASAKACRYIQPVSDRTVYWEYLRQKASG
ncbi:unnamed protein product [marine sediment metagenome]|uniref:Uncharacterized protein n=1 Tax=marine sediment metagenome TaxID=412755 RepID=X1JU68_9ZZZZ